jgi:hypothetical protein
MQLDSTESRIVGFIYPNSGFLSGTAKHSVSTPLNRFLTGLLTVSCYLAAKRSHRERFTANLILAPRFLQRLHCKHCRKRGAI